MTILSSDLGGSDAVNGTALPATDWNDTMGALSVWRKEHTESTGQTTTSATYATVDTFTIGALNGLITGMYYQMEISNSGANNNSVRLLVTGTTLGTYRLTLGMQNDSADPVVTLQPRLDTDDGSTDHLFYTIGAAVTKCSGSSTMGLKLLDTTTTVVVQAKTDGGTMTVDEIRIDVVGVAKFKEL